MAISSISKSAKEFYLISKERGIPLTSGRLLAERIGVEPAVSADIVTIGSTKNSEQRRVVTTYRDASNNPVEMIHEFFGYDDKPEVHRLYRTIPSALRTMKGRLIQTIENLDPTGKFRAWKKVASEKQFIESSPVTNEKEFVTIAKVKTDERNLGKTRTETHSLTEYTVPNKHNGFSHQKRSIEFNTEKDDYGVPQISEIKTTSDVNVPENDNYLALRLYDTEDVRIPIAKKALEEGGLKKLDVPIEIDHSKSDGEVGSFNYRSGIISFNSNSEDKLDTVDTAYHETRHAQQYALMAVTKKVNKTPYAVRCQTMYKGQVTPEMEAKADKYFEAHKNYKKASENYDEYRTNLLEEEAWDAGERGSDNYFIQGEDLYSQFRHMPASEL